MSGAATSSTSKLCAIASSSSPHSVKPMPDGQRVGLGLAIGVEADDGLQQRGGDLVGEGEQPDLPKDRR